ASPSVHPIILAMQIPSPDQRPKSALDVEDLSAFLVKAQKNLNDSLRHFEDAPQGLEQLFVDLKLQACIFQYDICAEMAAIIRNRSQGFAECVALKGLVLRLFEYDLALKKHIIPRLLALAKERGVPVESSHVRELKRKWSNELQQLEAWAAVRNKAAGHYERDL